MAIVKMKKIRLLAARSQKEELLRELMLIGCVEVSEPTFDHAEVGLELAQRGGEQSPEKIKVKIDRLHTALTLLDKYAPVKTSILAPLPEVQWENLEQDGELEKLKPLAEEIIFTDERIRGAITEEAQIRNTITSLLPWENLDLPLEFCETRLCAVMTGTIPVGANLEELEAALKCEYEASHLKVISEDADCYYVLAICMKSEHEKVLEILRNYSFMHTNFTGIKGTAKENIEKYTAYIEELDRKNEELAEQIKSYAERRGDLMRRIDYHTTTMERAAAATNFLSTEHTVYFEGWLSAPDEELLKKHLEKFDCAWETEEPKVEEYPEVPTKLKNGKFSSPLNMVTEMYALPAYGGVDPNPFMAPFFILFYGIMMADMGYGLLMILISVLLFKKKKARGGLRNAAGLFGLCGISTFIVGALTGGFFGDFLTHIAAFFGKEFELPYLFNSIEDTMAILVGSLVLGFIQMITGMAIGVWKKVKGGDVLSAVFDEITWWTMLAGLIVYVLGSMMSIGNAQVGLIILYIGLGMLAIGQFVQTKSFFKGLGGIVGALYNGVAGMFSDILSYSRLMALMLSGGIIATVFNTLGAVPGNIFAFLIIASLGNALNFALSVLGCYVHDLRLQCLEFFNRFYEDGGRPFKPLAVNTKYYNIFKEEN